MESPSSSSAAAGGAQQRNAEIWSTRVQKELLALTTDNADAESTDEVRSMLPPFCRVQQHELNLENGICIVDFEVKVGSSNSGGTSNTTQEGDSTLIVSINASLAKHRSTGKIDLSKPAYPFHEPTAYLRSGQECFPIGSTIRNGNRITMDLDWTPSLHLTDAIMNIGLKIKESILQKEPFHPAPPPTTTSPTAKAQNAFAAAFGKAITGVKNRTTSKKTPSPTHKKRQPPPPTTPENIRIGDEIDLLTEPWAAAHGVYSCKAIRRPKFVEMAMQAANERQEQDAFQSPTAMFRSFAQSARSVIEESFLMITETHIIELRANKLNMTTAKVSFAISIDMMAKLKFRRQESLSLFFKPAPDDPLIYMCPDSGDAVHQIQSVLKRHGVKGKHTNAAAHRAISEALHLVQEIQTKELALKHDPTTARVNEIMDLYRQAAERFEVAGDIRHEEVVTHMRKFLALPLTASILDGSFVKPENPAPKKKTSSEGIPEGEVLESPSGPGCYEDDFEETEDGSNTGARSISEKEKENDKAFEENIDNLLKEAQSMKLDAPPPPPSSSETDDAGMSDVAADLDAMMAAADKELAELMKV